MKLQVLPPSENLGCLGFHVGSLYFDFYRTPHLGMFFALPKCRGWLWLRGFKIEAQRTLIFFRLTVKKHLIYRRYNELGMRVNS